MQTHGLCLCSTARSLQGRKRSRELCNQSTDSFKISLGGHGRAALHAGTQLPSITYFQVVIRVRLSVVTMTENCNTTLYDGDEKFEH